MNRDNASYELIPHDEETGEIEEGSKTLSELASQAAHRPDYWRESTRDALISNVGPEFMKAFMQVQEEVGGVIQKDSSTARNSNSKSKFDYDYASLGAVMARVITVMHKAGLVLQQYPGKIHGLSGSNKVMIAEIHTRITHAETGQFQIAVSPIPLETLSYKEKDKDGSEVKRFTDIVTPQAFGKSFTYGRRYALLAYLGIATEDKEKINPLLEEINQYEYEKIAEPIINGMNSCKSIQDLKEWGLNNRDLVRNVSHPKVSKLVTERYLELSDRLPEVATEDETKDQPKTKKTVKQKPGQGQMDIEDAIKGAA